MEKYLKVPNWLGCLCLTESHLGTFETYTLNLKSSCHFIPFTCLTMNYWEAVWRWDYVKKKYHLGLSEQYLWEETIIHSYISVNRCNIYQLCLGCVMNLPFWGTATWSKWARRAGMMQVFLLRKCNKTLAMWGGGSALFWSWEVSPGWQGEVVTLEGGALTVGPSAERARLQMGPFGAKFN